MAEPIRVTLGPHYSPDLWDLHKHIARLDRRAKIPVIVRVSAPIQSEQIDVAILSDSLYLIGIRGKSGQWHEFANDEGLANSSLLRNAKPRLSGSRFITVGDGLALSTYGALRVGGKIAYAAGKGQDFGHIGTPIELIQYFAHWPGTLNRHEDRERVFVLILLICEALRFRSVETICSDWVAGRGPEAPSRRLVITAALLDKLQNWNAMAKAGVRDADLTMTRPEFPDPLID